MIIMPKNPFFSEIPSKLRYIVCKGQSPSFFIYIEKSFLSNDPATVFFDEHLKN